MHSATPTNAPVFLRLSVKPLICTAASKPWWQQQQRHHMALFLRSRRINSSSALQSIDSSVSVASYGEHITVQPLWHIRGRASWGSVTDIHGQHSGPHSTEPHPLCRSIAPVVQPHAKHNRPPQTQTFESRSSAHAHVPQALFNSQM